MTVQINETSLVYRITESYCERLKDAMPKRAGQKLKQFEERFFLNDLLSKQFQQTFFEMTDWKQHKQESTLRPIYEWSKGCGKFMQTALISALND